MTDRCRVSGDASTDCQNFQIVPFNAIIIIIIIVIIKSVWLTGAETPVMLALIPPNASSPRGQFLSEKAVQQWGWDDHTVPSVCWRCTCTFLTSQYFFVYVFVLCPASGFCGIVSDTIDQLLCESCYLLGC